MKEPVYTLLLIEDDPKAVFLLEETLRGREKVRFDVTATQTLKQALELLPTKRFDIILVDLSLPDSHGLESFEKVQAAASETPVIVLTGSDDETLALRAVHGGAQDYLVKGSEAHAVLIKSILYAIERKRNQSALVKAREEIELQVEERTSELMEANRQLNFEISERRQTQHALQESNRLLQETLNELKATQGKIIERERLHALGNMASGIAHDFNNALAPILGFSDLLLLKQENMADQEKVKRYLQMIRSAAQDASAVVGRLREFYRERDARETRESVTLNDIISKSLMLTKPCWRDQAMARGVNITIETDLQRVPQITGNPHDLQELFTNLILNAVESIDGDGIICVRTNVHDGQVEVRVSDNGAGMSDETRRRCMEPFFSTKGREGSGFGLPTVYGIIERHGGTLEIESRLGEGTTIRMLLPISPPQNKLELNGKEYAGAPLRILVVDDEPLLREVIVACLSGDGHVVTTASDGVEGLELFKSEKFDLVITDRAMPRMNGDQLAQKIKELVPTIYIILLTGFGALMEASNEKPAAIDLVVSKPFTIEGLRSAISQAIMGLPKSEELTPA